LLQHILWSAELLTVNSLNIDYRTLRNFNDKIKINQLFNKIAVGLFGGVKKTSLVIQFDKLIKLYRISRFTWSLQSGSAFLYRVSQKSRTI